MKVSMTSVLRENRQYLDAFNKTLAHDRVPLAGSIELTQKCNLKCMHCYLGGNGCEQELDTQKWISIINDITDAGCLFLLITGGEPLLRPDFARIYKHAKTRGLLVTVFSNGALVSNSLADLFADMPPQLVEISIYGAKPETHDQITGVPGSFERSLSGARLLLARNTKVTLKTILMKPNRLEFFDMENMAKELGAKFRFDAAIFPCFNGDKRPIDLRVDPEEVVEKDFADPKRQKEWMDYYEKARNFPREDTLYSCGAGLTNFYIDAAGALKPCLMIHHISSDLTKNSFQHAWNNVMPRIFKKNGAGDYACSTCDMRALCDYCPAFFRLENGSETKRSEYLCQTGHYRFSAIKRLRANGEINA